VRTQAVFHANFISDMQTYDSDIDLFSLRSMSSAYK